MILLYKSNFYQLKDLMRGFKFELIIEEITQMGNLVQIISKFQVTNWVEKSRIL